MSMIALGAYLWRLRESMGLSRDTVAKQLQSNRVQIERIEYGSGEARASIVHALSRAVGGNPIHVDELIAAPDATADDGRALADQWLKLTPSQRERAIQMIDEQGPQSIREAVDYLRSLPPDERLRVIAELSGNSATNGDRGTGRSWGLARRGWKPR